VVYLTAHLARHEHLATKSLRVSKINMKTSNNGADANKQNPGTYVTWIALASAIAVFGFSYHLTGDLNRSLILPGKVVLPLFVVAKIWLIRQAQLKSSGQSKDEFAASEAGGRAGLLKVAKTLRIVAWIFLALPFLIASALWGKSAQLATIVGVAIGFGFIPLSLWCFWSARNRRLAAEKPAPGKSVGRVLTAKPSGS
jgi:hypothetical protein